MSTTIHKPHPSDEYNSWPREARERASAWFGGDDELSLWRTLQRMTQPEGGVPAALRARARRAVARERTIQTIQRMTMTEGGGDTAAIAAIAIAAPAAIAASELQAMGLARTAGELAAAAGAEYVRPRATFGWQNTRRGWAAARRVARRVGGRAVSWLAGHGAHLEVVVVVVEGEVAATSLQWGSRGRTRDWRASAR